MLKPFVRWFGLAALVSAGSASAQTPPPPAGPPPRSAFVSAAELARIRHDITAVRLVQQALQMQLDHDALRPASAEERERIESRLKATSAELSRLARTAEEICAGFKAADGYVGWVVQVRVDSSGRGKAGQVAEVRSVYPASPAEKAGVRVGDRVISVGGAAVDGHTIELVQPGKELALVIERGGEKVVSSMKITPRPPAFRTDCELISMELGDSAASRSGLSFTMRPRTATAGTISPTRIAVQPNRLYVLSPAFGSLLSPGGDVAFGAHVARISGEGWKATFGVTEGLLVTEVDSGSSAAESGLLGGDVIQKAGSIPTLQVSDLMRAIAEAKERRVELQIVRKQQARRIVLKW